MPLLFSQILLQVKKIQGGICRSFDGNSSDISWSQVLSFVSYICDFWYVDA